MRFTRNCSQNQGAAISFSVQVCDFEITTYCAIAFISFKNVLAHNPAAFLTW